MTTYMTIEHPTRRERLRSATVAEIKDLARRLLVAGGPHAISLRAIARDMGMTAPAIYRYFPSLDALVKELAEDLYDELREAVEAARGPDGRSRSSSWPTMARAFRRWSVGAPGRVRADVRQPGARRGHVRGRVPRRPTTPGPGSARRSSRCSPRSGRPAPLPTPPAELIAAQLGPAPAALPTRPRGVDLPVEAIYAYLSAWTRLYGLVAMEVFGHLQWAVDRGGAAVRAGAGRVPGPAAPSSVGLRRQGRPCRRRRRPAPARGRRAGGATPRCALARRFDDLHQLIYRRGGIRPSNAAVEEVAKLVLVRLWSLRHPAARLAPAGRAATLFDDVAPAAFPPAFAAALAAPDLMAAHPSAGDQPFWPVGEPFRITDPDVLAAAAAASSPTRSDRGRRRVADPLGTAFDALLAGRYDHAGGLGTYLTPSGVARMMAEIARRAGRGAGAGPPAGPGFGDPYCGTGRFLVALLEVLRERDDPAARRLLAAGPFGADQSAAAVAKARINMLLYGVHRPLVWTVRDSVTDSDVDRLTGRVPLILTNPPFGEGKYDDPAGLAATGAAIPRLAGRRRIDPSLAGLVRSVRLLAPGGVLGIVLPDGVVAVAGLRGPRAGRDRPAGRRDRPSRRRCRCRRRPSRSVARWPRRARCSCAAARRAGAGRAGGAGPGRARGLPAPGRAGRARPGRQRPAAIARAGHDGPGPGRSTRRPAWWSRASIRWSPSVAPGRGALARPVPARPGGDGGPPATAARRAGSSCAST